MCIRDSVRTAIEQELSRGGQVYFVHNRVESIWSRAAWIQEQVPGARVAVGHGQMGEDELEKVLLSFMHREADVLVCTTIVENGLDLSLIHISKSYSAMRSARMAARREAGLARSM